MLEHYADWQIKRLRYLGRVLPDIKGKTVLELGAMYGEIGKQLYLRGAKVDCIEGRKENMYIGVDNNPDLGWELANLDSYEIKKHYDIIINFGLIYHLRFPERSIVDCLKNCDILMLESECVDSLDSNKKLAFVEDTKLVDQSITGIGCRLSPSFIERIFTENGFNFEIVNSEECNSGTHIYNWKHENNDRVLMNGGTRRMWKAWRIK